MKFFLIILLLLTGICLKSQNIETGLPAIKNFSPKDYGHESQNFSIVQDTNLIMYFGNARGIMEFDNTDWNLAKTKSFPRLDINSKNEIYFGAYNQLGKVIYTNGNIDIREFEFLENFKPVDVKKVVAFNDKVFFATDHQLLVYRNDTVELELSNAQNLEIFKYNDDLLVFIPGRGLWYWNGSRLITNQSLEKLRNIHIKDIIKINDKDMLIKPSQDENSLYKQKGFYRITNNKLTRFYTEADQFITDNQYSCSAVLENGQILIGTVHGGLVCIDKKGNYLYSINRENGLRDNQVTDIYIDKDQHAWVTTFNGITLIETESDFSFFNSAYGINGTVISISRFENELYVGTTNGLFKIIDCDVYDYQRNSFNVKSRFGRFNEIKTNCWEISRIGSYLYAFTNNGIYKIHKNNAEKIIDGEFRDIIKMRGNEDIYLIGSKRGLLIANISDERLDTIGHLKRLKSPLRTISQDYRGIVWMGSDQDGLYSVNFNNGLSLNAEVKHYTDDHGLPKGYTWVDLFDSYQGLLFSTGKGVYRYNNSRDRFHVDTLLGIDFTPENKFLYPIVEDTNKNLWYSCIHDNRYERETGVMVFKGTNKKYEPKFKKFMQIDQYTIESIYPEGESVVWFGSSDALIKLTRSEGIDRNKKFPCMIRRISFSKDSVIYLAPDSARYFILDYLNNKIRFDFTAISYNTIGNTEYQVMLEGFDEDWLDWTQEPFKEYTSLHEKNYNFRVRARDIYGNISDEANISFSVKQPFYKTVYAYVLYIIIIGSIIYLLLKYNVLRHVREKYKLEKIVEERTNELAQQKEQVEQLIKKLLPQSAADELQETGNAKSEKYELVTVLFADIQRFTEIAENTNPEELIAHLNKIFGVFDKVISKYNIQKIKTIGDAYMCAGGMPTRDYTNPVEVVLAALEMQRELKKINDKNPLKLEMRVGIHTGPVVSGVVGESKIEYDIWGDTVNIASRMETHGKIGKVNISAATQYLINDFFDCEYRGEIEVKYKGVMKMFFVENIKKDLSNDGIIPNKTFNIKLQTIQYKMIENEMLDKLQSTLPSNMYYHNVKHTINVIYIVEDIARKEGVNDEEMLLLKCAALFHDTGFMVSYDNNEETGANFAEQTLSKYKFSKEQIQTVKRLILATKMPPKPKDLLEKIICDADLDYLGRPDFIPISQNLFRELFERGKIGTITQWNKMQYRFVRDHHYFTETARKERDMGKQNVLRQLEDII